VSSPCLIPLVQRRFGDSPAFAAERSGDLGSGMRLAFVHVVSAKRKPDYASHLFLDVAFVAQLGYCHTGERRIDGLLRQSHELAGVVFVVLGQSNEKFGLDGRWLHLINSGSSVPRGDISRNGPSVPASVTLVECTNAAGSYRVNRRRV